jgi:hypothetical protein
MHQTLKSVVSVKTPAARSMREAALIIAVRHEVA